MNIFSEKYDAFLKEFDKGKTMVLSSSENDKVTSRMMSVVCIEGQFYFQTDKTFRKYHQLISNPHVALCIDNIQIEGICEEIGRPIDNPSFCEKFKACFEGSYKAYSELENERVFVVRPLFIERWVYKDGKAYMENFYVENQEYELNQYVGV